MIRKFAKVFISFDIGIILFCLLQDNMIWLINTQIAFISSLLIIIGSYLGYKRNIKKRLNNFQVDTKEPDYIDKIDDQFDLYSEFDINQNELSKEEVKEIFEEEKQKLKNQNTLKNTFQSLSGASSFYRVIGYIFLVFGFFYLNNNLLLDPISYLAGFIIVPMATLMTKLSNKLI
jgi:hypothetical protein